MSKNKPVTKEQIETLQAMLAEGLALLDAAAQYAGKHDIPLKYIDDFYEEPEEGEEEENYDEYGPRLRFGGQGFSLEEGSKGHYYWHNSNCY
jgi:hypothetical protein